MGERGSLDSPACLLLKRRFGKKLHRRIAGRVVKAQVRGMEKHLSALPAVAVEAVADDWRGKPQGVGGV